MVVANISVALGALHALPHLVPAFRRVGHTQQQACAPRLCRVSKVARVPVSNSFAELGFELRPHRLHLDPLL